MADMTDEQKAAIAEVNRLANAERREVAEAQRQADEMVEKVRRTHRGLTNAAILEAVRMHGARPSHIARDGFGNTDRTNVYTRLKEATDAE